MSLPLEMKMLWGYKMYYLKKSCLTNRHKKLNFANFENGPTNIKRGIAHMLLDILSISLLSSINNARLAISICKKISHFS